MFHLFISVPRLKCATYLIICSGGIPSDSVKYLIYALSCGFSWSPVLTEILSSLVLSFSSSFYAYSLSLFCKIPVPGLPKCFMVSLVFLGCSPWMPLSTCMIQKAPLCSNCICPIVKSLHHVHKWMLPGASKHSLPKPEFIMFCSQLAVICPGFPISVNGIIFHLVTQAQSSSNSMLILLPIVHVHSGHKSHQLMF